MADIILLNSQNLIELKGTLLLNKKYQKHSINYYFLPNIGLKLYNAKVSWIDPLKKHISFEFNKYINSGLYSLVKFINEKLIDLYINYNSENIDKIVAPFYFEKGDNFYIRCFLPKNTSGYTIKSQFDNEPEERFNIPRIGCVYKSIILTFRNIWEDENNLKSGFHLELKNVFINSN